MNAEPPPIDPEHGGGGPPFTKGRFLLRSVKALCSSCGEVNPLLSSLLVRPGLSRMPGTYRFDCPSCATPVEMRATAATIDLLVACGATMEASVDGPVNGHFTDADVAEFAALLADDGALTSVLDNHR